ncbi:short-chain dehydrogenase [Niastella koreensis]|uniref:3-oxoacyl-(Acyl-carrier-protein) reductase n=2 Tax=Niastella koreensis TaxID=354356 RepID=G8TJY7_NIAKG|nr:SDR family oxidoreductase [Niastella koreensis]AEW02925.1 3-oxoacyl-(acyl-carrier-protein) reductase [Niastella koreensis GR20-10]OQP55246.1 short-chain dehydrogenase [Niastella koreensis]
MDLHLTNKVFIVTGGAKGIGAAISSSLAAEGGIVVIAGRNKADNQAKVDEIIKAKGKATSIEAELADPAACKAVIDFTVKEFGRIDGLINNAGMNDGCGLESGSPEKFMKSLQINLSHIYNLAHYALPYLKETKGTITNIGSKVADTGQGNTSGYAASKGGINALTREWAVELLPYSIRVNTVIPAEVWTPLYDKWIQTLPNPKEKLAQIVSKIPLEKRFTTSEEIADMTVFLISDRSSHTTGQIIYVDGGYTHLDRSLT